MCGRCHGDWDYHGCYGYQRRYGPRWGYYEEIGPEERREYLDEEKRILENRLKDLEARIAEISKTK